MTDGLAVDGDPSQDVVYASVLFLVDAKLVLLQPAVDEAGGRKYDMRIIANDVEWFMFARDQLPTRASPLHIAPASTPDSPLHIAPASTPDSPSPGAGDERGPPGLQDSLWYFDGRQVRCWPDLADVIRAAVSDGSKDLPRPISIPVDFYPTCISLDKGVIIGVESEISQRRDAPFSWLRYPVRVSPFSSLA